MTTDTSKSDVITLLFWREFTSPGASIGEVILKFSSISTFLYKVDTKPVLINYEFLTYNELAPYVYSVFIKHHGWFSNIGSSLYSPNKPDASYYLLHMMNVIIKNNSKENLLKQLGNVLNKECLYEYSRNLSKYS